MLQTSRTLTSLKFRLYVMMFLQYFVQGCFLPIISVYLEEALGFQSRELGQFAAVLAIGPLLAALFVGQIVDRHFQTQHVLALAHLVAGVLMILLYLQQTYWPVIVLGTLYAILYTPTIMLTNSLTFHHLKDREREFPLIRVWGTIGFIVPAWLIEVFFLEGLQDKAEAANVRGIALLFAGVAGLVLALYCLTLPKTLPTGGKSGRFAPGAVLRLLSLRSMFVLVGASFGIALVHKFYFIWNGPFVKAMLLRGEVKGFWVHRISSLGQVAEIGVMVLLTWSIMRLGFKRTMILGIVAYLMRCMIFAAAAGMDGPFSLVMTLVCLGQMMHGLCFACFLAAAFMYVDRECPPDIRGSMQTFYGTFVLGLGFFIGSFAGGEIGAAFTTDPGQVTVRQQLGIESTAGAYEFEQETKQGQTHRSVRDWPGIWLSSAAMTIICLIGFTLLFPPTAPGREKDEPAKDDDG